MSITNNLRWPHNNNQRSYFDSIYGYRTTQSIVVPLQRKVTPTDEENITAGTGPVVWNDEIVPLIWSWSTEPHQNLNSITRLALLFIFEKTHGVSHILESVFRIFLPGSVVKHSTVHLLGNVSSYSASEIKSIIVIYHIRFYLALNSTKLRCSHWKWM